MQPTLHYGFGVNRGVVPMVGDAVKVSAYGYGARVEDCGKAGVVVALYRNRADVAFADGSVRRIGVCCLMKPTAPKLTSN